MNEQRRKSRSGFALVLVLALVALCVLATVALSALAKVNAETARASEFRVQACQNALVGLGIALGQLQRKAGADGVVTGIAGMTDLGPGSANTTRHWAGVWRNDGTLIGWLASGADSVSPSVISSYQTIELVSTGAVGTASDNQEHVVAGRVSIPSASGNLAGRYAWLVLDEGVKTSLYAPNPVGVAPAIFPGTTATQPNSQSRLSDAISANGGSVPRLLSYEHIAVNPFAASMKPATVRDNFHHISLTPRWVVGGQLYSGFQNINTNSVFVWRNLFQAYNNSGPTVQLTSSTLSTRGTNVQARIANFSATGKATKGPFTSVAAASAFFTNIFPSGSPTAAQIFSVLAPQLAVRSDTFRIRACGEAINPANDTTVEAMAYCEAIVQRTPDAAPNGLGRRFVVTYFRWLGPDDI